jgi:signal transduction histidine kinase
LNAGAHLARRRLLVQLGSVVAFVSLAFIGVSLLRYRTELETHRLVDVSQTQSRTESLETVVTLRGVTLRNYAADYSLWGDLATFAANPDPKWAATNLEASLATFKTTFLWVFDRSGAPRYRAAEAEAGDAPELPPGTEGGVTAVFAASPTVHYFAPLADGALLEVRGAWIQSEDDTERTGEVFGYFFVAKRWDAAYVEELRALTGGEALLVAPGESCGDGRDDSIDVGMDLVGLEGPAARLCARIVDPSAALLSRSSDTTFVSLLAFAGAMFVVLAALLHLLVARPIRRIGKALASGDAGGLASLRPRADELGDLARAVVDYQNAVKEREVLRAQVYQSGKMASLGVLGAGVAHELNNPLAAVLCHADMLVLAAREGAIDPEEASESASAILEQAERMRDIVDHIRAFSRAEGGAPYLLPQPINPVVEGSVLFLRGHVEHHGITLTLRLAKDLPEVACDKVMLESIVQNLVLNASDELVESGVASPAIVIETRPGPGGEVLLSVRDNGRGIPEAVRDKVFEPFFTTKDVGKGTGLGLSLVHGMVGQHLGKVSFDTCDEGTTFEVVLPPASLRAHAA